MIDPNEVTTARVGELPPAPFELTDNIPHEIGDTLFRGTVQQLGDVIGDYLGAVSGLSFNNTVVPDGGTLPDTETKEWLFVGKGTFHNVGGQPDIITTEVLNILSSNGIYWSLAVEIPIDVELAGITQNIRSGYTETTPSEDAVYKRIAEIIGMIPQDTDDISNVSNVDGSTITEALNNLENSIPTSEVFVFKNTIAEIRALSGTLPSNNFYTTDLGQEGNWYYDASDTTSADNIGTILVTADGKRIKRAYSGAVNFKWFGAIGDGVANNSSMFNTVIASFSNVYIPKGVYKINTTISASNKTIYGDRPSYDGSTITAGTIIDGGFEVTGSYLNISSIGIINGSSSNGFTIKNNAQYVNISDCMIKVPDHGILTQSFGGTCKNIRVLNCDAYGGIHGFVSKAENVTYENCRSFGASVDGFAMVSDNFENASNLNQCINNNLINCEVYNTATGITIYSRDYYSTTNANNVVLRDLNIIGGNIKTTTSYAILVGDESTVPGGQTYNDVLNISINGVNIDDIAVAGIKYARCNGVMVTATNTTKPYSKNTTAKNVRHSQNNITTSSLGAVIFNTVLTANSTTPSVLNGETYFETANTVSTNITNFTGAKVGNVITVFIKDDFTSIINSGTMKVRNVIRGNGSFVTLKQRNDLSGWDEMDSFISDKFQFFNYASSMTIDYSFSDNARTTLTGNVTSLLFSNMTKNYIFRFLLAWDGSTRTISGWDSRIVWMGGNAPSSIPNYDRLVLEFYYDGTNIINTYRSDILNRPLTGYVSGAGTVSSTDTVLQAIQKLNGNDGVSASYTPTVTASTNVTSATLSTANYTKIGNIVTGSIAINMQATAINLLSEITFTAPVNRAGVVPNYYMGNGTYATDITYSAGNAFFSSFGTSTITLRFNSGASVASPGNLVFTFQYDVTK